MSNTVYNRRSIRLPGYDYSQVGAYFVTVVTQNRLSLFGEIQNGEMLVNDIGRMVETCWLGLRLRFPRIHLGENIVMPNHFHGIIIIINESVGATLVVDQPGAGTRPAPTNPTLGDMMMTFKSITTHEYIIGVKQSGWPPFDKRIWQRNYYEHIIRSEAELQQVCDYIRNNPLKWSLDEENPQKG